MVITCGDKEFKAHRAIVCPQCPVIEAAADASLTVWLPANTSLR
jgi:hypothetical protein